jgi:hypothetical protein
MMKKPRLFYWEEAEDYWVPIELQHIDAILNLEDMDNDVELTLTFKRVDMTDEEFDAIPEG